jgi:hypothetical protein
MAPQADSGWFLEGDIDVEEVFFEENDVYGDEDGDNEFAELIEYLDNQRW